MLRGVNRRIIEVNDIGSECFEKALFFIKSNNTAPYERLEEEAKKIVDYHFGSDIKQIPHEGFLRSFEKQRSFKRKMLILAVGVIALTAITIACTVLK